MMAVAMIRTSAVVATASAWANSPLASPSAPIVWKSARIAVVPKTTSPSAVTKTISATRPDRVADDRQDQAQGQDHDEEMPETHRSQVSCDFGVSRPPRPGARRFPWIMTRLSRPPVNR